MRECQGLTADDVMLVVTTLSFDIAGLELYLPLSTGASVVIVSRETAANPEQLLAAVEHSHATVMQATPVTWRLLFDAGWRNGTVVKRCRASLPDGSSKTVHRTSGAMAWHAA